MKPSLRKLHINPKAQYILVTISGKNCSAGTPRLLCADRYSDSGQEKASEEIQIAADVDISGCALTRPCKRGKAVTNIKSKGNPARYSFSRASMITYDIDLGYLQRADL
jgi:hypothetical protein